QQRSLIKYCGDEKIVNFMNCKECLSLNEVEMRSRVDYSSLTSWSTFSGKIGDDRR
ncbi:3625_t:CDS:1, partial [Funneliformis geosporum]